MILVFGSINVDVVVPVPVLPHPGETVLGGDYRLLPGGKGANQALAARRAGADVTLVGAIGDDAFAELALANLRADGVDLALVRSVAAPTGCAAIMVDSSGENIIAVAPGANRTLVAAAVPDALLGPRTLVLCQMEVPPEETASLLQRARAAGARTVLNLAPASPVASDLLSAVDVLVVNESEAATLGAEPGRLASSLGLMLVVTQGRAGASGHLAAGGQIAVPALPITPIDTTGAGDTFVGVLAAALDAASDPAMALRRASAAAGLACLATGAQTAMPDAAAIAGALRNLPG